MSHAEITAKKLGEEQFHRLGDFAEFGGADSAQPPPLQTSVATRPVDPKIYAAELIARAPILHDPWYPELREQVGTPLRLLARSLAFVDPLDGTARRFESGQALAL